MREGDKLQYSCKTKVAEGIFAWKNPSFAWEISADI